VRVISDVLILGGLGLVAYGLWLVYQPAMFVFVGLAVLVIGYLLGVNEGGPANRPD